MSVPEILRQLYAYAESKHLKAALMMVGTIFLWALLKYLVNPQVRKFLLSRRPNLEERVIRRTQQAAELTLFLFAVYFGLEQFGVDPQSRYLLKSLMTGLIILWGWIIGHYGLSFIEQWVGIGEEKGQFPIQLIPVLESAYRILVMVGVVYSLLLVWQFKSYGVLASAGVVGVVLGLAAQETLGNFFSGVTVMLDGPFKINDFLVLPDGTRGRVTEFGLRSTRLLTRDNVEIIIPNRLMATNQIINESGGINTSERLVIPVSVAYGSDLAEVRKALVEAAHRCKYAIQDSDRFAPSVLFRSFEDSGIKVTLLFWIARPDVLEAATDQIIMNIAEVFAERKIEIPFPQRVITMKS